jgi:hypothetical protein
MKQWRGIYASNGIAVSAFSDLSCLWVVAPFILSSCFTRNYLMFVVCMLSETVDFVVGISFKGYNV